MRGYRKPYRFKRKKPILRNKFFWFGILISFFVISLFYFLFFSPIFQAEEIIITGEARASAENLKELVGNKLENKVLFVRTKSIFAVKSNEIRENIINSFPQIAEVEIRRGFPDSLHVLVKERMEVALWCQAGDCLLLDNEGIVFGDFYTDKDLIRIVDKRDTGSFMLGGEVIKKEDVSKILDISINLKSDPEIPLKEFIVDEEKLIALVEDDWKIYFDLGGDTEWQLTKLKAVLEEKIPPERQKDLEYIELRFGNFAPYKYRD